MKKMMVPVIFCLLSILTACEKAPIAQTLQVIDTPIIITINSDSTQKKENSQDNTTKQTPRVKELQAINEKTEHNLNRYRDVLVAYYTCMSELKKLKGQDIDNMTAGLVYSIIYPYWTGDQGDDALTKIGFSFLDLNDDGKDELVFGWSSNDYWNMDEGYVFAIYTVVNEKAILAVEGGERYRYLVGEDGYLYEDSSDSAWESYYTKYRVNAECSNFCEPIEELFSFMNDEGTCSWGHITDPKDIGVAEYTDRRKDLLIDEDEALAIGETWMKSGITIDYTTLSDYVVS
jgi:hypothetical protein